MKGIKIDELSFKPHRLLYIMSPFEEYVQKIKACDNNLRTFDVMKNLIRVTLINMNNVIIRPFASVDHASILKISVLLVLIYQGQLIKFYQSHSTIPQPTRPYTMVSGSRIVARMLQAQRFRTLSRRYSITCESPHESLSQIT